MTELPQPRAASVPDAPAGPRGLASEHRVFLAVFSVLAFQSLFSLPASNLNDILPGARQFAEPGWIKNDWYLDLPIGNRSIRLAFYSLFGPLTRVMSFQWLAFLGSILVIALFACVIESFGALFGAGPAVLVPAAIVASRWQSIVAGETLFGGRLFEAKCFAYAASFLALFALIRRKYASAFLYQGIAVSFHALVGVYGLICLAGAAALNATDFREDVRRMLRCVPLLLLTGSVGIWTSAGQLLANRGADSTAASVMYVTLRVPHHALPSAWPARAWAWALAGALALLAAAAFWKRDLKYRAVAAYLYCGAGLFAVGLALWTMGRIAPLKYYWFRFADGSIPFLGVLLAAAIVGDWLKERPRASAAAALAAAALGVCVAGPNAVRALSSEGRGVIASGWEIEPQQRDALEWISRNTDNGDVFLIFPGIETFYVFARRAVFVSFKSVPQSEGDMIEWHRRMVVCNRGRAIRGRGVEAYKEVYGNFHSFTAQELRVLAARYGLAYYLGNQDSKLPFPMAFSNSKYRLFALKTPGAGR
ncbi:MAG: hypothetical protein HY078_05465 [Elusimicrobia bacterium]|nr:hypothetical protein [Elusimicrobiota bacterium]